MNYLIIIETTNILTVKKIEHTPVEIVAKRFEQLFGNGITFMCIIGESPMLFEPRTKKFVPVINNNTLKDLMAILGIEVNRVLFSQSQNGIINLRETNTRLSYGFDFLQNYDSKLPTMSRTNNARFLKNFFEFHGITSEDIEKYTNSNTDLWMDDFSEDEKFSSFNFNVNISEGTWVYITTLYDIFRSSPKESIKEFLLKFV